jgi:electron transfer flavoprotein beta subunit
MRFIVCIKQVPGTTQVSINDETNTLVREGVESIINPFDTYAIEEGVSLKDRFGGQVAVMTMGPQQAEAALREAISVGADDAVLISDRAFAGSDTLATALVLSKAISKMGEHDLIITGKQTMDGDTGQVGPGIAQRLDLPFVGYVSSIEEITDGRMRVKRMTDDGYEVIEVALPCVISVVKEINVPRVPSIRGKMKAKSAQIPVWTAQDLDANPDEVGVGGSPTRVIRIWSPKREQRSEMIEGDAESQVSQLIDKLKELTIV